MNIGEMIDLLYTTRALRLEKEKEAEELKKIESKIDLELKQEFLNHNLDGGRGKLASFGIKKEFIPEVPSWDDFRNHISSTGEWDLIQKRIGVTAWKERFESGIIVPGTEAVEILKSYLRKV